MSGQQSAVSSLLVSNSSIFQFAMFSSPRVKTAQGGKKYHTYYDAFYGRGCRGQEFGKTGPLGRRFFFFLGQNTRKRLVTGRRTTDYADVTDNLEEEVTAFRFPFVLSVQSVV